MRAGDKPCDINYLDWNKPVAINAHRVDWIILDSELAADTPYPGISNADVGLNSSKWIVGRGYGQLSGSVEEGRLAHICLPNQADHHGL